MDGGLSILPLISIGPKSAEGGFMPFRIGDAVASRNIHAAIYDGIRFGLRI
jgi:hypothetical protein